MKWPWKSSFCCAYKALTGPVHLYLNAIRLCLLLYDDVVRGPLYLYFVCKHILWSLCVSGSIIGYGVALISLNSLLRLELGIYSLSWECSAWLQYIAICVHFDDLREQSSCTQQSTNECTETVYIHSVVVTLAHCLTTKGVIPKCKLLRRNGKTQRLLRSNL